MEDYSQNWMHSADPVQILLFFEGGKILNEEGSGTARAGCWRVAKQRAGTRPRQQTTVWLQMELWSSCGPGIQAGYPELTLIRSLYELWTTLNNHSRSHPLSDAAVRASIGLFIILQMRSRVCMSGVWSSPGVPGPGPTPCRAGRDAGDVSQQIIHNDDKFLTWTSARSLKIFQKNQTIHSLQMIKWVKVKIAVPTSIILCLCHYLLLHTKTSPWKKYLSLSL